MFQMVGSVVFKEQKHFMWANVIHTSLNNKQNISKELDNSKYI